MRKPARSKRAKKEDEEKNVSSRQNRHPIYSPKHANKWYRSVVCIPREEKLNIRSWQPDKSRKGASRRSEKRSLCEKNSVHGVKNSCLVYMAFHSHRSSSKVIGPRSRSCGLRYSRRNFAPAAVVVVDVVVVACRNFGPCPSHRPCLLCWDWTEDRIPFRFR
jgi:hypothetical protein